MLAKKPTANTRAEERLRIQSEEIEETIQEKFDAKGLTVRFHCGQARHYPKPFQKLTDEPEWTHASYCVELSRN